VIEKMGDDRLAMHRSAEAPVTAFEEKMLSYSDYHRDPRNKLTHVFGVPLVVFALFQAMAWFRFTLTDAPISLATVFWASVMLYYLKLDWVVALLQAPVTLALLWGAERAAALPAGLSVAVFLAAFIGGSLIQLLGHKFEGRKPALVDNFTQIFNAPLFLVCEALFLLGMRNAQHTWLESELAAIKARH
jgi:uncharacterized membrane protein YGL010W